MTTLNFNKIQKKYLTVTLNDEANTTLLVLNPNKKILDALVELEATTKNKDIYNDKDQIDYLYKLCSIILNRNLNKIKITEEQISEIFDTEDIQILFETYLEFVKQQMAGKN